MGLITNNQAASPLVHNTIILHFHTQTSFTFQHFLSLYFSGTRHWVCVCVCVFVCVCTLKFFLFFLSDFIKFLDGTVNEFKTASFHYISSSLFASVPFLTLILLTWKIWWAPNTASRWQIGFNSAFNPLNSELNSICHFLALLGARHIFHVSKVRVKGFKRYEVCSFLKLLHIVKISADKCTCTYFEGSWTDGFVHTQLVNYSA